MSALVSFLDGPYRRRLAALPAGPIEGIDSVTGHLFEEVARAIEAGGGIAALDAPLREYPENGAWAYLAAVAEARAGRIDEALHRIRQGNAATEWVFALPKVPTLSACAALPVLQGMVDQADGLIGHDPAAVEDLLTMGIRVARSEPRSVVHLIVGASMAMGFLKADMAAALRDEDRKRIAESEKRAAEHRRWLAAAKAAASRSMRGYLLGRGRICRAAGITLEDMHRCLADAETAPDVRSRFEKIRELEYRKEREDVAPILLRMPPR